MYVITIDVDTCQGCGDCVATCPADMFEVRDGKAIVVGDSDDCLGCEACVNACETNSITISET